MTYKNEKEFWEAVLNRIKRSLNPQSFKSWILPIKFLSREGRRVYLEVPNAFFKNWISERYFSVINEALTEVCGEQPEIEFVVEPKLKKEEEYAQKIVIERDPSSHIPTQNLSVCSRYKELGLNPKYTFDNFVVGPSNRFAHAASLAVVDAPARSYNPLFLYGAVGLGKTHLMQAMGHGIAQRFPNVKILYISSERFTNQLISAIQNKTTHRFRQLYRTVDILLIDDIHFIGGKESTQEEFFHTFNTLYDSHRQIVISSDRPPKEIPGLEERLISRFEWGLVCDIQSPDLETRIAILRKKIEKETVGVPDDVTFYIADKIKSNIRELEGALIRTVAYAKLHNCPVTIDLVKNLLKDMFVEEERKITIDLIQKKVAEYFDIRLSDMISKKRTASLTFPRQLAMYLSREFTNYSLPEIGARFGGRDHSTVIHACEKVQRDINQKPSVKLLLNELVSLIKSY